MTCDIYLLVDADGTHFASEEKENTLQAFSENDGVVPARMFKITVQLTKPADQEVLVNVPDAPSLIDVKVSEQ